MAVRIAKPTSPGRRGSTVRDFATITAKSPAKSLVRALKKTGGRNNQGRITVRHIGGGHKRRYRLIEFKRRFGTATVKSIEYDPNRSAFIALIQYEDGQLSYILAPRDLSVGATVESAEKTTVKIGNSMLMKHIPTGIAIHNIEVMPGKGGTIVRSAGLSASVLAHEGGKVVIKLPSTELRRIPDHCFATIGEVSNRTHENTVYGKAGRKRWLGIRPTVRGKAMNPNSHPHGGGEGVNPIGLKYPKTPWGAPALGHRTRDRNKPGASLIMKRRGK